MSHAKTKYPAQDRKSFGDPTPLSASCHAQVFVASEEPGGAVAMAIRALALHAYGACGAFFFFRLD